MKLKKWENPNLTSLNIEATETCTYDSPHYYHCNNCHKPVVLPTQDFKCPDCGGPVTEIGCGPHPS